MNNEDECQAMSMKFADTDCKHNNAISLAFRKLDTRASDKVTELTQQTRNETFGVEFHDAFSCSIQDLAASAITKESQVDKVEHAMHQGDKVGASAVGELARTASKVNLLMTCVVVVMQCFTFNLMCFL